MTQLAARLQSREQDTLTAEEIEAVGTEVGLEPSFIRQALTRVAPGHASMEQLRPDWHRARQTEAWSLLGAWGGALIWATLAFFGWRLDGSVFFTLVAPAPLAVLLGFAAGRRAAGLTAGLVLIASLPPTLFRQALEAFSGLDQSNPVDYAWQTTLAYLLVGAPITGLLSWSGARLREHYLPLRPSQPTLSRQGLLNLLFSLQHVLEGQRQHRAFLSVDVVGSTEMKRSAPDLAVEHSFGQFSQWVEQVARAHGGEVQVAAGDGTMCLFPTDAGALRAARQLLLELPHFNQSHNHLSLPFRIRCGVSAGAVAIDEGTPLGQLQSPVIDRAAALQKRAEPNGIVVSSEVAGTALLKLGNLAPLPEPVAGEAGFWWHATPPAPHP